MIGQVKRCFVGALIVSVVLIGVTFEAAAQNKVVVIPLMETPTGPPAPVAKTGQTASYRAGDDGDHEAGVAWPNLRFVDNSNGTVTDKLTGLIWLENGNCEKFALIDGTGQNSRPWSQAVGSCNLLGNDYCSLTDGSQSGDWRLPNMNELNSLIDLSQRAPALPSNCPLAVSSMSFYWSANTYVGNTDGAFRVNFGNGNREWYYKTGVYDVLCVRSGQ